MSQKALEFLKSCYMPGALPSVLKKANSIVNEPNIPQARMSRLLTSDPVITAKILRSANSAINRGKTAIGEMSQAFTTLGLKQMRILVKSIDGTESFSEEVNTYLKIEDFWRRSLAVGTCSTIIDRLLGGNSDEIYSAGLLHDFGRLIILLNPDKLPTLKLLEESRSSNELVYKHERKHLGFNHMELADSLFEEWNMPIAIRECAAFHHSPVLAVRCRYETAIVHIADVICSAMEIGQNGDTHVSLYDENARRLLNLSTDQLDYICEETSHQIEERFKLFQ